MRDRKSYVEVEFDCKAHPDDDIETVTKRVPVTGSDDLLILDLSAVKVPENAVWACIRPRQLVQALGRVL